MRVRICSLLLFLSTWDVDVVVENFYTFRLILYTSSFALMFEYYPPYNLLTPVTSSPGTCPPPILSPPSRVQFKRFTNDATKAMVQDAECLQLQVRIYKGVVCILVYYILNEHALREVVVVF